MSVTRNLLITAVVCSALLMTGVADAKKARRQAGACTAATTTTPAGATSMGGMGSMGGGMSTAGGGSGAGPAEAALLRHFDDMDTNKDGLLSKAEITAYFANLRAQVDARLRAADTNGDQQLSREEAQAALPMVFALFDFLDADHDGQVTRAELYRLMTPEGLDEMRQAIVTRVKAADTNGDGMLDLAEVQTGLPGLASRFTLLDRNGDGLLTPDELRAAI